MTGGERRIDARQVAATMFLPVVAQARSTNTYLRNGARLYLDVGSHPEYATAETRDPFDALEQDLAGESVICRLALQAQERTTSIPRDTPSDAMRIIWFDATCRFRSSNVSCCRS